MPLPTPYVLAAPGYLAGANAWDHLTEWLLRGHGWRDASTIDYHTLLTSPDGSLHVGHDRRGAWTWNLHATSPAGRHWTATLGAHLPVEYVTALVETMLRPHTGQRADILGPLHTAGWTTDAEAAAPTAVSPDGLVRFAQENAADPSPHAWHSACTVDGHTWWTAAFTAHTPPRLVAAFTDSLACRDPLPRMAIGIPMYRCGPYTRRTPTTFGWDDEQALLEARIAEARRQRLPSARTSGPPPPTIRIRPTRMH